MEALKSRSMIRWKLCEAFSKKVLPIIRRVGVILLWVVTVCAVAIMLLVGPLLTIGLFLGRSYDYLLLAIMAASDFLFLFFVVFLYQWIGGKPGKLFEIIRR